MPILLDIVRGAKRMQPLLLPMGVRQTTKFFVEQLLTNRQAMELF